MRENKVSHVKLSGVEMFIRTVRKSPAATSSHVNLPKDWNGRKVAVVLLEEEIDLG